MAQSSWAKAHYWALYLDMTQPWHPSPARFYMPFVKNMLGQAFKQTKEHARLI